MSINLYLIIGLVFSIFEIVGNNKANASFTGTEGDLFTSINQDTLIVKASPNYQKSIFNTRLSIIKVKNDSRCPLNAKCKWAGNAEVSFKLKRKGQIPRVFTLNTNDKYKTEIIINNYTYQLLHLSPERKSGSPILPMQYKAKVVIKKNN